MSKFTDNPSTNNTADDERPNISDSIQDPNIKLEIETIKLILSEKRTSLAVLRTGIAILALPLSIFSALIATSKLYEPSAVFGMLFLVLLINGILIGIASWLIVKSFLKMRRCNQAIWQMQKHHPALKNLMS